MEEKPLVKEEPLEDQIDMAVELLKKAKFILVVQGSQFIEEIMPSAKSKGPFAFWEKNSKFRELLLTEEQVLSPKFLETHPNHF